MARADAIQSKVHVLLLYPRFPDTFWSMRHALCFVRKQSAMPPLGLLTVAAMLPKDWSLRLVDTNVASLRKEDLDWADLAMVSAMAVQRDSARQLIARCRAAGLTTVAGGPLFTSEPDAFPEVDHLVLNEGELTVPPFIDDFLHGRAHRVYASTGFADLCQTPTPRWDLLDMRQYATMELQYSRGCPFNCDFCNVTAMFGRTPRVKPAAQIVAELESLRNAGWRGSVFFVDDNLIGNRKAARTDLLPALAQWQRRFGRRGCSLSTQATITIADDPALLKLLADAGFDTVFVGIETPSTQGLAECGKVQNQGRDMLRDVKQVQRFGIQVQGGFIVGFDSDDGSIFQRQIDFIQRSGIVTAMVGLLQALPGTVLYERMRAAGRLLSDDSGTGNNVDGTTNILPLLGLDAIRAGYQRVLRAIYAPRPYYRRLRTFLRDYRRPAVRGHLDRIRFHAFLRSLVMLGIVGRERLQYWYLLAWTLLRRPRLLPYAVTLAISGHHLRRVCQGLRLTPVSAV